MAAYFPQRYFDVVHLFLDSGGHAQLLAAEGARQTHREIEVAHWDR